MSVQRTLPRLFLISIAFLLSACTQPNSIEPRGTGDLGIIIERANGSVLIVDTTERKRIGHVTGLGDLSHASAVYSRDGRFAYVFGRDGGLSKIDLLTGRLAKRIVQAGNSIGGAISQNGRLIAVSNYKPGGIKIFNAESLTLVADIPARVNGSDVRSKVVGLVDAPGQQFVAGLYNAGEIWLIDAANPKKVRTKRFQNVGEKPYDGLITPSGRHYIAGLFGEDGLAMVDLWNPQHGAKRILANYGRGKKKLPVYKMPHLEGWAIAGNYAFFPAVGRHEVLVADTQSWRIIERIPVHGQPIFVMARPDGRKVWVNFALPHNDTLQVIDVPTRKIVKTLKPGKGVLHMEFTPRGEEVWASVRDADKVIVYDTESYKAVKEIPALKPSGIFFTARAHRIGL